MMFVGIVFARIYCKEVIYILLKWCMIVWSSPEMSEENIRISKNCIPYKDATIQIAYQISVLVNIAVRPCKICFFVFSVFQLHEFDCSSLQFPAKSNTYLICKSPNCGL